MSTVTTLKALVKQLNVALELDETQRAMPKAERTRYILKLDQARTKLAQLEGLGQAVHSTHQDSNKVKRELSRARVKVVTTYNYGRRKSGFKATCMTGNGISYASERSCSPQAYEIPFPVMHVALNPLLRRP